MTLLADDEKKAIWGKMKGEKLMTDTPVLPFIDDTPLYVEGFIALGGKGILFDENDEHSDLPYPRIRALREANQFL